MGAILPYFGHLTFQISTFQDYHGLDLKSKVVSGYDQTPKIFLDLNPINYEGQLNLFWP